MTNAYMCLAAISNAGKECDEKERETEAAEKRHQFKQFIVIQTNSIQLESEMCC